MNKKTNILSYAIPLLLLLLLFILVYSPVIRGHYFYGDDYIRLWTSPIGEETNQSYVSYARKIPAEGRPLHLLYAHIIFNKYIKHYKAANTVRIIGIIGVGLLSYILYLIFKANKFRTNHAILLSILICTLPPIQVYLGWLISLVDIYSILLSALSFLVLFKAVFKEDSLEKTELSIALSISIILFIASLCIYQPTATTYWALAIIPIIVMNNEDFLKKWYLRFTIYFSTGFVSMILYFAIIKIMNLKLGLAFQDRGTLITGVDQLYHRLLWFINYPLKDALNLWNVIYYTNEVALFVSMVIFIGVLYSLIRTVWQVIAEKKGLNLLLNLLCKFILIIFVVLLSFTAHLATMGSPVYYSHGVTYITEHRTLAPLDIGVLLLFYWGLMNIAEFIKKLFNSSADVQNKIVTTCLIVLTIVTSFLAYHNIEKYIVKHNTNEYMYVKDIIQRYGISKLSKDSMIYIKPAGLPPLKSGGDIRSIYGEFYRRSLGSNSSMVVKLVLHELGINSDMPIVTIHNYDPVTNEPIDEHDKRYKRLPEDENILKIDMSKMSIKETYDLIE
jgi:hypothetical protein